MNDLCVRRLIQKHRELEISIRDIEALLVDTNATVCEQFSSGRLLLVTAEFARRVNGLLRAKEEVLFPALDPYFSSDTGPLAVLRSEHASVRAFVASMRRHAKVLSGEDGATPDWDEYRRDAETAVGILRSQMYKEDRVFFPMVARLLPPEQDALLAERISQIDSNRRPRLIAKMNPPAAAQFIPNPGQKRAFASGK